MGQFKADLIGVYDQVNTKTGIPFVSCSFSVGAGKIATTGANDKRDGEGNITDDLAARVKKAYEEAKARGMGLIFEVSNAVLIEETEELEDGLVVPFVKNGNHYYKIATAEVGSHIQFKKIGEVARGGSAEFIL